MYEDGIKIAFAEDGTARVLNDEYCIYCADEKTVNKVREAVDKQIPKKVTVNRVICHCPNCNTVLGDIFKHPYCDKCGQALDWSECN